MSTKTETKAENKTTNERTIEREKKKTRNRHRNRKKRISLTFYTFIIFSIEKQIFFLFGECTCTHTLALRQTHIFKAQHVSTINAYITNGRYCCQAPTIIWHISSKNTFLFASNNLQLANARDFWYLIPRILHW